MATQERAWKAAERQAQRLREQADEEQGLLDAINNATDQAEAAAIQRRERPRPPGGAGGIGDEWEGQARGYYGETRAADLEAFFTCTGLFPMADLWYLGEEMHCQGCYERKVHVGRHKMQEQGTQGDMVALIGAAVRETLKAASETSKDTTTKDSKLAVLLATTIQYSHFT